MKGRKLVMALGLVALLLVTGSIVGCDQPSSPSETHQSANPLEDITNPDNHKQMPMKAVGWPEGSPAVSGIIEKLTGNTFDLREELISVGGSGGEQPQVKIWQVVFSSDTRVFRPKFIVGKAEGGETPEELSVYDLEEGQNIIVWGEVNGNRIFADTIAIMSGAMLTK